MTAEGIIILFLIALLIFITLYYRSGSYYVGTIVQTASGNDGWNNYRYYFDVQYTKRSSVLVNCNITKTKRIEVTRDVFSFYKASDKILIKA